LIKNNAYSNSFGHESGSSSIQSRGLPLRLATLSSGITTDSDFIDFMKRRLADTPLIDGDNILIPRLGQPIPFVVVRTRPHGIVLTTETTSVRICSSPSAIDRKKLCRRGWLVDLKEWTKAEEVKFIIPDRGEWDDERTALSEASKLAKDSGQPVTVFVGLRAEGQVKLDEKVGICSGGPRRRCRIRLRRGTLGRPAPWLGPRERPPGYFQGALDRKKLGI